MKIRYIILFLSMAFCNFCYTQKYALISNQHLNLELYNPSVCTDNKAVNISLLARQQWVGFENAPSTKVLTLKTFIKKYKTGLGVVVLNDVIGQESASSLLIDGNYKVSIGQFFNISMGIGGGFVNQSYKAADLIYEETDPYGSYESFSSLIPQVSAGINMNYAKYNAGFSFNKIMDNKEDEMELEYPYFLNGHANTSFAINRNYSLEPFVFFYRSMKSQHVMPGGKLYFEEKYWVSMAWRSSESLITLLGTTLFDKITIEYSYDFAIGNLYRYHNGSHEIYVRFRIPRKEKEYFYHKSPRFF